jgi:amidase
VSDELARLDATAQAELVRRGELTPVELVLAAIARIEKLNPQLNAVIHPLFEKARAQAASPALPLGPFRGVPFLVKDAVCHTAGDPYHCGMRWLRELDWREESDTYLAARFRAAGFVFVGKTNTPELASAPTTEPLAYGPTRNPWDPERSTGGSSGGSAAAVAAGLVPVAHGNDMGGSIRIPASACGLVGLKPTRARSTLGPDFGEYWWALTHEHVLTRSVRDSAAVLDAIAGPAPGDPYSAPPPARPFALEPGRSPGRLRVGLRTQRPGGGEEAHADCRAAVERAGHLLEALGHCVEWAWPAALDAAFDGSEFVVFATALARDLERWGERTGRALGAGDVEPTNELMAEVGRGVTGTRLVAAVESLQRRARGLARWWAEGFDLLVTPTLGEPPPRLGWLGAAGGAEPRELLARYGRFAPFTTPFNVSGQPALSLPLSWNEQGLPIGVQLVAATAREDLLLRVAAQLEEAAPWRDRWPTLRA